MAANFHFGPRDRSLQAFREWIEGKYQLRPMTKATVATKLWITDKEWIENWKKYWAKVDGSSKG